MIKRFFTLCLFGVISLSMYASHFMGAEMYSECINACTYRIHHKSFYDCSGGAVTLPPGQTAIPGLSFNGLPSGCSVNPQLIGNWVFGYNIDITPVCPSLIGLNSCAYSNPTVIGVAEAYWYADYDICAGGTPSGCTGLEVSYYACCRNGAITSGAANDGIFVRMTVAIDSGACNNSPVFNQSPEAMICSGTSMIMDHSATDPDGDSLVYSLTHCYSNNGLAVGYNFGYTAQNFLGPTWITNLDPITGMLSIIPNSIGAPVIGVVCVTVDEYRNGVHIGSVSRDFQVVVVNCTNSTQVNSTGIQNIDGGAITAPNTIEICAGLPVSFDLVAIDPDPMDSIFISSNLGALFGNSSETTSGTNPATYSVSFTPGPQQIGSSYQLQVLIDYAVFALTRYDDKTQKPYPMGKKELGQVNTPVYLIVGDKDPLFPFQKSIAAAQRNLPKLAGLMVLPDVGHGIETYGTALSIVKGWIDEF